MRCLDCLFGGPFLIMLLPALNHLGDLLRVLRRGVVAPHLRFYPMFWGSPSGFLLLKPPDSVHPCIIQVSTVIVHVSFVTQPIAAFALVPDSRSQVSRAMAA